MVQIHLRRSGAGAALRCDLVLGHNRNPTANAVGTVALALLQVFVPVGPYLLHDIYERDTLTRLNSTLALPSVPERLSADPCHDCKEPYPRLESFCQATAWYSGRNILETKYTLLESLVKEVESA